MMGHCHHHSRSRWHTNDLHSDHHHGYRIHHCRRVHCYHRNLRDFPVHHFRMMDRCHHHSRPRWHTNDLHSDDDDHHHCCCSVIDGRPAEYHHTIDRTKHYFDENHHFPLVHHHPHRKWKHFHPVLDRHRCHTPCRGGPKMIPQYSHRNDHHHHHRHWDCHCLECYHDHFRNTRHLLPAHVFHGDPNVNILMDPPFHYRPCCYQRRKHRHPLPHDGICPRGTDSMHCDHYYHRHLLHYSFDDPIHDRRHHSRLPHHPYAAVAVYQNFRNCRSFHVHHLRYSSSCDHSPPYHQHLHHH